MLDVATGVSVRVAVAAPPVGVVVGVLVLLVELIVICPGDRVTLARIGSPVESVGSTMTTWTSVSVTVAWPAAIALKRIAAAWPPPVGPPVGGPPRRVIAPAEIVPVPLFPLNGLET